MSMATQNIGLGQRGPGPVGQATGAMTSFVYIFIFDIIYVAGQLSGVVTL